MAYFMSHRLRTVCRKSVLPSSRYFWDWLVLKFNAVDHKRVKEVGPDRVCAEWLLRNEAIVRFRGNVAHLRDYNSLPSLKSENATKFVLEEFIAKDCSINGPGFAHVYGCVHLKKVVIQNCKHIDDSALEYLVDICTNQRYKVPMYIPESLRRPIALEHVELIDLPTVTHVAVQRFLDLSSLRYLHLSKINITDTRRLQELVDLFAKRAPRAKLVLK